MLVFSFLIRFFCFRHKDMQLTCRPLSTGLKLRRIMGWGSFAAWLDGPIILRLMSIFFWGFGSLATELSLFGKLLVVYLINLLPNLFDIATSFLIFAARGNAIKLMMHRSSPAKINNNESAILPAIFKHHKKLVHGSVTGSPRSFHT